MLRKRIRLVAPLAIRLKKNGCEHWFEKGYCVNCKLPSLYQIQREEESQQSEREKEFRRRLEDRRKVYNPRWLRWEYENGDPCEGPEEEVKDKTFHFGDFKGCKVDEVPTYYLKFCIRELTKLNATFRKAIEREIRNRGAD